MTKYIMHSTVYLLLFILFTGGIIEAEQGKTITTIFEWERSIEIGETQIPFKVSIPIFMIVDGLPEKAKPGETFQLSMEITPSEGAFIEIFDKTFNIDGAIEQATTKTYEIDLSVLSPLTSSILTKILEEQLKLPPDAAESLASTAQKHTKLILSSDLKIDTNIKGSASSTPSSMSTWFNEVNSQTLKISRTARDGEKIEITYDLAWRLVLKMDLAEEIYTDSIAGPIMKNLANLIGLPLTKEMGSIQGDEKLIHTIQIQAPLQITLEIILIGIGIAVAIGLISVFILLKHPRKPSWR